MSLLEIHVWRKIPRGKVYLCTSTKKDGSRCFAEAVVCCLRRHPDRFTVEMAEAGGRCDTARCQRHMPRGPVTYSSRSSPASSARSRRPGRRGGGASGSGLASRTAASGQGDRGERSSRVDPSSFDDSSP